MQRGVVVAGLAPDPVDAPWPNTYGIWADELKPLGLESLLGHRWSDTVSYFGAGGSPAQNQSTSHRLDYGLLDRASLQRHWLDRAAAVTWHQDRAEQVEAGLATTTVRCASGQSLTARLVIDASGARTPHIQRPDQGPVAGQAAYGVGGSVLQQPRRSGPVCADGLPLRSPQPSTAPRTAHLSLCDGSGRWGVLCGGDLPRPGAGCSLRRAQATAAATARSTRCGHHRGAA